MKKLIFAAVLIASNGSLHAFAEEIPYDRYAPIATEKQIPEKPYLQHVLVYPFEFLRWPVRKILTFTEEHYLYDKAQFIYEKIKNRGVTPKVRISTDGPGAGFELDFLRITRLQEATPNSIFKASAFWTADHLSDYQIKMKQEQIAGTRIFVGGKIFQYENRGEEHFYGIGPETSLGDGTSYRMERTTLAFPFGYEISDTLKVEGKFDYKNVNITNGEDGGRGEIDQIFVATGRQRIPGLGGDEILGWGLGVDHDNRDDQELPTQGGYQRFHISFNKGLESSSGYFKYRGEAAHFFRLASDRRVLAVRGVVEHNDEVGDRDVPFFDMTRLGGFASYPRLGDVQRGFRRDRFYDESLVLFNLEYRWAVLEYREWRMDSVLLMDTGQVFGEWSHFQFRDFEISYGMGFRISFEGEVLLALEIARSHEGTQLYAKTRTPF